MDLKYFSIFYSIYSMLSIITLYLNYEVISIIGLILAFISAYFLRRVFKKLTSRQEFKIPYAGAYLMLLGYLGILIGIPASSISVVHLLGLTLVLIGALFVDIGILTALVLGNFRLSNLTQNSKLKIIAILFLLGLITSFDIRVVSYMLYLISSFLTLAESL
ncbi:hypothetical protein [Sulfurisphaera ohwakuensis]|uniref:Energy-converting hydrogenase Eha subunit E n=1 Tax=Sulfurisphaera ohwakuensis TaxID=69656 RepID=A0A650CHX9_SULOH|nr:hypothetical protein [Sulfurisphaera ohwakuensis]MBB5253606.1 energy-converting hydrogenase Eha subunit E [Sulfurisphaera ohwakuensis]QGR17376.1 hypothetical protein D1869_09360 [Sulfurisphaera ohwakuensis]